MSDRHNFAISVEVDTDTGELLAVYFRIRKGRTVETREFANGRAFADYNSKGQLLGIEMLEPCEVKDLDNIAKDEPETQRFLHRTVPWQMALAN